MDESASQALAMAFGLFVLVIALSISVYMISEVAVISERLLYYSDSTSYYESIKYTGAISGDEEINERYVDSDTIIPILYRYSKENFCVKIYDARGGTAELVQIFDINLENAVERSSRDNQATLSSSEDPQKQHYALKTIYNDNSKPYYMFGAPWTGSTENIKKRIDYFINGESGYINETYVDYSGNKFNEAINGSTAKFRERFINYSYSGDTYVTEDGDELTNIDTKDKIVIIYTIV